jgi:hypothetical protein
MATQSSPDHLGPDRRQEMRDTDDQQGPDR